MDIEADNTSEISNEQDDLILSGDEDSSLQLAENTETPTKHAPKVVISQIAREDFVNGKKRDKVLRVNS